MESLPALFSTYTRGEGGVGWGRGLPHPDAIKAENLCQPQCSSSLLLCLTGNRETPALFFFKMGLSIASIKKKLRFFYYIIHILSLPCGLVDVYSANAETLQPPLFIHKHMPHATHQRWSVETAKRARHKLCFLPKTHPNVAACIIWTDESSDLFPFYVPTSQSVQIHKIYDVHLHKHISHFLR